MSGVEEKARKVARRFKLQDSIVMALYAAAAFTLALAAPNVVQLLAQVDPDTAAKRHPSRRIDQAASRLKTRGLIEKDKEGRSRLTKKGIKYAEKLDSKGRLLIPKSRRWDGRWRIVIFDIWERRKSVRERLRELLKQAGFVKVQASVWAYPYDCEDLIEFLRADLRIGKGIIYMIAEGVEGDEHLLRHFELSR